MKDLTPGDISEWLRERARTFNQMAESIESTFKFMPSPESVTNPVARNFGAIGVDMVRRAVSEKAMRVATIAKHFNVPEYEVERIIDSSESGLKRGNKGWITIKD